MKKRAQTTQTKKPSNPIIHLNVRQRLFEGLFILLAAAGVYLFVALLSYHHSDPAWSNTGFNHFTANAGGFLGAWLSDVLLYFFGYMAYWFPILLLQPLIPVLLNYAKTPVKIENYQLWLRAVGFLQIIAAGCALLTLHLGGVSAHLSLDAGGVVGDLIGPAFLDVFNVYGANLILTALLLIGLTLFTGLSWLVLARFLGIGLLKFGRWLFQRMAAFWFSESESSVLSGKKINVRRKLPVSEKIDEAPVVHAPVIKETPTVKPVKMPINMQSSGNIMPSLDWLNVPSETQQEGYSTQELEVLSELVENKLLDYGIEAKVKDVFPGPVITRFELELAPGIKVSKITPLAKDLARSLSQTRVRIVEHIPGRAVIGLEIPNPNREIVYIREMLESDAYKVSASPLSLALGKDIGGRPVVVDLGKMPHLLVAGTTGSGKSVSINTMIFSLLYKSPPEDVRFIMIDPKMLELSVYEGIPHLLTPVVTDMREAANALRWCVNEMDKRYRWMAALGVRHLTRFNQRVRDAEAAGKPIIDPLIPQEILENEEEKPLLQPLPYIVVIVDELADMMMVVGKKVEELIARLAQKARAAGIHMILATQRPSVDVITGLIKANIPTRISFQVSSRIDSRTILDQQGAEQLLGQGDMLYLPAGTAHPTRVHGAYVSDEEVQRVVAALKEIGGGETDYSEEILKEQPAAGADYQADGSVEGEKDALYDQAVSIVLESRRASISYVQRRLKIGYNRAAGILEEMEKDGIVSAMEGNGIRKVLVKGE